MSTEHPRYFNKEGKPITIEELLTLEIDNKNYRRVAFWISWSGEEVVSTVWTGIDTTWGYATKPLIFETAYKTRDGEFTILESYASLEAAELGHRKWVLHHGGDPDAIIPEDAIETWSEDLF